MTKNSFLEDVTLLKEKLVQTSMCYVFLKRLVIKSQRIQFQKFYPVIVLFIVMRLNQVILNDTKRKQAFCLKLVKFEHLNNFWNTKYYPINFSFYMHLEASDTEKVVCDFLPLTHFLHVVLHRSNPGPHCFQSVYMSRKCG